MTKKRDPLFCHNCDNELGSNQYKFCSEDCFQEHAFTRRYEEWLNGSIVTHRRTLRKYLIRLNGNCCSVCGITEWNNKPIVFEVDHEDGCAANNAKENLRLICANCHSQTPSFAGRNLGRGRGSLGLSIR